MIASWVSIGVLVLVSGWAWYETSRLLNSMENRLSYAQRRAGNARMFRAVGAWQWTVAACLIALGVDHGNGSVAAFNIPGVVALAGMGSFFLFASRHPWVLTHDWGQDEETTDPRPKE